MWHHCGIWAKNLAACRFAEAVDGGSLHLVLDHDICDTAMVLPEQNSDGNWRFERLEIESEQRDVPLEFRQLPQRTHFRRFVDAVVNARTGQLCAAAWPECEMLSNDKISGLNNIAELITYLQSLLNAALGLNIMYLPVSMLSQSDAFVNFVIPIMVDATGLASSYNSAVSTQIAEQRDNHGGKLRFLLIDITTGLTELPFWLVSPNGKRGSLCVTVDKTGKIRVGTASNELGNLDSASQSGKVHQFKQILQQSGYRLRPKAVSLTLFVRLFLADWFIHGIGGAFYEGVTDYIIQNYYRKNALRFGVATCTMMLPLSNTPGSTKDNLSQLKHKLHNIKHGPERYIEDSVLKRQPVVSLVREKEQLIHQATDSSLPSSARRSAWDSLSVINEKLLQYAKGTAEMLKKRIAELETDTISQEACDHREYFFGIFPKERLDKVAASVTF